MPSTPTALPPHMQSRIPTNSRRSCFNRERRLTVDLGTTAAMLNSSSSSSAAHSRCHTPTMNSSSPAASMMNGSFTLTVPRERPNPSPKCFGKNTHILKEEYERERIRWEKKLEEAEQKLTESSVHNSELFQLKAELNRKIIDFEKTQKPLIEQNRRLNDRVRTANMETRKVEEKLAYVHDELLSLRDQFERVVKENAALREQRAFPEKLEELGRYRAQVLEMSKCITALRQSAAEKDRRHELLILKMKKMRRTAQEADRQSCAAGSEGSVEDSGSIGLDTITEDLDEEVDLMSTELLIGGRVQADYVIIRQQLDMANEQLADMQREMERAQMENADRMAGTVGKIKSEMDGMRRRERALEQQLANVQAQNELLEFQLVELTEGNQQQKRADFADKHCSTDFCMPIEKTRPEESRLEDAEAGKRRRTLNGEWLKTAMDGMRVATDFPLLEWNQRVAIRHGLEAIECFQNKLSFAETELNMANCENGRLQRELEQREGELERQKAEAQNERQQRKKELKAELEVLRKEKRDEAASYAKQVEELSAALNQKIHTIGNISDRMAELGVELDICRCQLTAAQAESGKQREELAEMGKKREQIEREIGVLKEKLETMEKQKERLAKEADERHEKLKEQIAKLRTEKEADKGQMDQLRMMNRELEAQFNTQMDMIGALKRKLLMMTEKVGNGTLKGGGGGGGANANGRPKWAAGITRSCGSTEDEQYHSEESDDVGQQQQHHHQHKGGGNGKCG